MKLSLPATVSSPQDLSEIILAVKKYARWFSQNEIKRRVTKTGSHQPPEILPDALAMIEKSANKDGLTQTNLDQLIAALETFAASAPHVVITTAAIAPNGLRTTMVAWCRQHMAANVLVDFKFNATLLGGMVIQYGSHVYDWSFRRQILTARASFAEVLKRV